MRLDCLGHFGVRERGGSNGAVVQRDGPAFGSVLGLRRRRRLVELELTSASPFSSASRCRASSRSSFEISFLISDLAVVVMGGHRSALCLWGSLVYANAASLDATREPRLRPRRRAYKSARVSLLWLRRPGGSNYGFELAVRH